ncbi:hypothetical protein [Mesorhizobium sp. WSM3864]|uniref:hypothetical protein n=1 Tax=Mesorhizobium sp. WSM3864 TaxID=2029404 RepID=UPI001140D82B|nr:hypothetical protein [Mesorhizobium sp. WSM3864]
MDEFDEFLDEYDDRADRLVGARYQDFGRAVRRFLQLLEEAPEPSASRLKWLRSLFPLERVQSEVMVEPSGMVGSGQLDWPDDNETALSAQLNLLASFADNDNEALQVARGYFYSRSNNVNDTLHEMTGHLFEPMIRDIRRYLSRNRDKPLDPGLAPASDRIVRIDHNRPEYVETVAAIEDAENAAVASNEIDPEERDRIKFELNAGIILLKAQSVRQSAIEAVLVRALKWLAENFAGAALGVVADQALQAVLKLLGSS